MNIKDQYKILESSKLFDKAWYEEHYVDIKHQNISPAEHYLTIGASEGRNPSKNFSTLDYFNDYKDILEAKVNPVVHFELFGKKEGRVVIKPLYKEYEYSDNTKNHFFSIIIASYNYEKYIRSTLDSLIEQTYNNFEVIIVDDGSTDKSIEIINQYLKYHKNIKLFTNDTNKGLPETINRGIEEAKGEYICFCESDDFWTKTHLECLNDYICKHKPEIIVNDVEIFGNIDKCLKMRNVIAHRKNEIINRKGEIPDDLFRTSNYIVTFSACCVIKSLLKTCNILDVPKKTSLDWWIWRQISLDTTIHYIDSKLTFWRLHDSYNFRDVEGDNKLHNKFLKELDTIILKRQSNKMTIQKDCYRKFCENDCINTILNIESTKKLLQNIKFNNSQNLNLRGIKILFITSTAQPNNLINDGSVRYRCYHPAEVLKELGAFVTITDSKSFFNNYTGEYDIYIFHRPHCEQIKNLRKLKALNKILIADYDDLIFGPPNIAYNSSIVKNKVKTAEEAELIFKNNLITLSYFDNFTCSTEQLALQIKYYKPEASINIIHNFIPQSLIHLSDHLKLRDTPKDPNTIMYCSGTLSHNKDFETIEDSIIELLSKTYMRLIIVGQLSVSKRLLNMRNIYFHPVVDYWIMLKIMSTASFTIAPLENSIFNNCKSNVKFLESSLVGCTLVASSISDFERVSDANILIVNNPKDWITNLNTLSTIEIKNNITNNFNYLINNCASATFKKEFINTISNYLEEK